MASLLLAGHAIGTDTVSLSDTPLTSAGSAWAQSSMGTRRAPCQANDFSWICDIEQGPTYQIYELEAKVYHIDRQYQLPQGTQLRGQGPDRTRIYAVGKASVYGCTEHVANRIGLVAGNDTYLGGFTFRGIETQRWVDGPDGLCGGGAIETPGCADANCAERYSTGNQDGSAVSNVLIEDVEIAIVEGKPNVQVNFYMARTRHGVSNNITVRGLRSQGSWADGLNVHGAHTNLLIEDCALANAGDDVFAMWSVADRMANVTFRNNTAYNPTYPWDGTPVPKWGSNHVNCFAAYGGSGHLKWLANRCVPAPHGVLPPQTSTVWNDTAVIVFHSNNFGGKFGSNAIATVQGNSHSHVTADGAPVRPSFPICAWAEGTAHEYPGLAEPRDHACTS
jgi:hypothetical protein